MNQQVAQKCRSHGLTIIGIRREGEVLVLEPADDGELPPAKSLRCLADDIDIEGIRYVALDLHAVTAEEGQRDGDG